MASLSYDFIVICVALISILPLQHLHADSLSPNHELQEIDGNSFENEVDDEAVTKTRLRVAALREAIQDFTQNLEKATDTIKRDIETQNTNSTSIQDKNDRVIKPSIPNGGGCADCETVSSLNPFNAVVSSVTNLVNALNNYLRRAFNRG